MTTFPVLSLTSSLGNSLLYPCYSLSINNAVEKHKQNKYITFFCGEKLYLLILQEHTNLNVSIQFIIALCALYICTNCACKQNQ